MLQRVVCGRFLTAVALCAAALPSTALGNDAGQAPAASEPADGLEQAARDAYDRAPSAWSGLGLLERLLQRDKVDEARQLADSLMASYPGDEQVLAQSAYLQFRLQNFGRAQELFAKALESHAWTAEQRRNLLRALANSSVAAGHPAVAVAALGALGPDLDVATRLQLGRAQLAARDRRAALVTARGIIAVATTVGDREDGEQLQKQALQAGTDPRGDKQLNIGYAYLRQKDDANGLASFQRGFALGSGKAFHYADAAYAAKRLGNNATAIELFRFSLDLDSLEHSFSPQRTYGFRREIETMERSWGAILGSPFHAGALNVWQGGLELYWQPPVIGYRNGQTLQFFARTYANFRNGIQGPVGWETLQETVGVRFKPLESQNIVLTAERLLAVGQTSVNDWLFRIGYSTGGGTDQRLDRTNWASWQVYGEGAYYLDARQLLIGTEARCGVTWPVPSYSRMTLFPHAFVAVEYDSKAIDELIDAVGPGLSVRVWFGEDRYRAPRGWAEVNATYRFADAERARGPALRATISY